jgi:hypothetical protein
MRGQMTVVPFQTIEGGFDSDALFESLKGHEYQQVLVLALNGSGQFEWYGSGDVPGAFYIMARAHKELQE